MQGPGGVSLPTQAGGDLPPIHAGIQLGLHCVQPQAVFALRVQVQAGADDFGVVTGRVVQVHYRLRGGPGWDGGLGYLLDRNDGCDVPGADRDTGGCHASEATTGLSSTEPASGGNVDLVPELVLVHVASARNDQPSGHRPQLGLAQRAEKLHGFFLTGRVLNVRETGRDSFRRTANERLVVPTLGQGGDPAGGLLIPGSLDRLLGGLRWSRRAGTVYHVLTEQAAQCDVVTVIVTAMDHVVIAAGLFDPGNSDLLGPSLLGGAVPATIFGLGDT